MSAIKSGDPVAIGRAVGIAPEWCEAGCGRPAVEFEAYRAADPWKSTVVGWCRECADHGRAVEAWTEAATPETRRAHEDLIQRHHDARIGRQIAEDDADIARRESEPLTWYQARLAKTEMLVAQARAELDAWRHSHAYPLLEA